MIGFAGKNSKLGKICEERRERKALFYGNADFYSANEVKKFLESVRFVDKTFVQTVFKNLMKQKELS